MPELPEVETIKNDLKQLIIGKEITDIRSEFPNIVKIDFSEFKKEVVGTKITEVRRRAKNLIIGLTDHSSQPLGSGAKKKPETYDLSPTNYLLIHFKMSGHVMVTSSDRKVKNGTWLRRDGEFADPQNQFVRIQFFLDDSKQIAFSDLRRFGYIKLVSQDELDKFLGEYGPEPLEKGFTIGVLASILQSKKWPVKKVLMEQKLIAGIGNIYADEILFDAKIHPQKPANFLDKNQTKTLLDSIQKILNLALENRGTSTSDYRDASGKKGNYGNIRKVYRKTGEPCPYDCGGKIERISLGGRGTHFCPSCQKM
ncbi:hypothetical protein COY62_03800 [bacterium (Candidatus Howlettbacteria) CG_4_10_14_0_8_um_filter_40_9]|nr:MAG: hypothetical protein COY62_03800 [bacterium (Candidatus Howlettbacteria) CG_4_10_14_0_8_um_filter_40_9]